MKLILVLICGFGLLGVMGKSYAQMTKLSLSMKDVTVREVLQNIEEHSEFSFMFDNNKVDVTRKVSVSVSNESIEEILKQLFAENQVKFEVIDRHIVLLPEEEVNSAQSVIQQQNVVSGKVTDSSGQPLPGVAVAVKGKTQGTVTDVNGNYSLSNIQPDAVLVFSFVGMKTQEIAVANKPTINVVMEEETIGIEEVVAIGYGVVKKSDLTGSVISANLEAFRESPNVNIMQSLQGTVPGVQIGQTTQAGEEPFIQVRGRNTLSGNREPLIVIDGIIYGGRINDINPKDVQSVDVLKDASSKAIYGSEAANGVIIITTKSGKINKKPTIGYSTSGSIQVPVINVRTHNREEFLQKVKDIDYEDAYLAPGYITPNPAWDYSHSELRPELLQGIENGTYYNWWDEATSPGYIMDHNLNLKGGTDLTTYYISGGYTDYKGFIMNDKYKRSTVMINLQSKVANWLSVGVNTFGSFADYSGDSPGLTLLEHMSCLVNSKDENGEYIINPLGNNVINPFLNSASDDKELKNRISGNFYSIISIPKIEGLSYRVNFQNATAWSYHARSSKYDNSQTGGAYKINSSSNNRTLDNIVTYDKQINNGHHINVTLVAGYSKASYETTNAKGSNIPNLSLSYNSLQQAITQNITSDAWNEASIYQMGRLNYNYKNKYLLTSTLRRDGYSGFARNNKIAFFPSVGLGWVLSEESFYKIPKMEYLKLRLSYGENGNKTARYSSLARVSSNNALKYVFGDGAQTALGQSVSSLANNDLSWEKTSGLNIGVDFTIFNNAIKGGIDYYQTSTTNLLWEVVLPEMTGFTEISSNLGRIENTGLEFTISSTPVKARDFRWDFDVNFSTNKNKIKELIGDVNGDGKEDDLIASGLFIGKSIGTVYNYEIDGVWQLKDNLMTGYYPGSYRIVDQNDDGQISADLDRKILGRSEPAYQFGIQNTLTYKNLILRFFINSIQGGKDGYLGKIHPDNLENSTGNCTQWSWFTLFNDYWTPTNPNAKYSQPWVASAIKPVRYDPRSFVRLQDVSISYRFKSSLLTKWGIEDLRIHISGKNLFTLTKWDGLDPEANQGFSVDYPVMKSYSLGIEVSL